MDPEDRKLLLPLLLGSLVLFALFLGLEPLLLFGAWGSDSGEYATLTRALLNHGQFLLSGYTGWGFGYPYFPGTFEVGAGIAAATGADPLWTLEVAIPALGALGAVPFFLFFRRVVPSDTAAFVGAALTSVSSVRLLVISHAAPQTLGDLLWIASLWFLVEQRRDPRWLVLLSLSSAALILTHHLSSYFFLISGVGLVLGLELYQPGRWSRRFPIRELAFMGAFAVGLFAYWFDYAPPFAQVIVTEGLLRASPILAPVGAVGGMVLCALVIHLRRTLARRKGSARGAWRLKWPSEWRKLRDGAVLGGLVLAGVAALFVVPLPGTQDYVSTLSALWYLPVLALVPLAAGMKGALPVSRLGPGAFALLIVIGLSALFALATANGEIPADRHPEFLVPPLALVAGLSVAILLEPGWLPVGRSKAATTLAVLAVLALVGANAATAYPPPAALEGFQEGFTPQDVSLAGWMAISLPAGTSLASDHRLSDLYFYDSGGNPASWDNSTCLFEGSNEFCAYHDLEDSFLPNPPIQGMVDVVAVDSTMRSTGVALDPSLPAVPMSAAALDRLQGPGFVLLYSAGGQSAWWVDWPEVPAPPG
jgi:hypothetical protein